MGTSAVAEGSAGFVEVVADLGQLCELVAEPIGAGYEVWVDAVVVEVVVDGGVDAVAVALEVVAAEPDEVEVLDAGVGDAEAEEVVAVDDAVAEEVVPVAEVVDAVA